MAESTLDDSAASLNFIGGAAGIVTFGVLAYVTVLLFEQLAVGVVVGALSGVGIFFAVPYTIRRADESYVRGDHENLARSFHPGAAGYALAGSGVVALALMFALEDALLSVLVALVVALTEYVALSRVLPRPGVARDEDDETEWSSDEWDD